MNTYLQQTDYFPESPVIIIKVTRIQIFFRNSTSAAILWIYLEGYFLRCSGGLLKNMVHMEYS